MLQKNLPISSAIWVIFCRFWFDFAALLHFLAEGKWKDAAAVSKAHRSFFKCFVHTASKRKSFKAQREVGECYKGSIVWDYYFRGKKKFSAIK